MCTRTSVIMLLSFFTILYSCASHRIDPGKESTKAYNEVYTVPLGGNTYLTSFNTSKDRVSASGITQWSDPASVFSTYFKVDKAGKIMLQLALGDSEGEGKIRVTVEGTSKEIKIPVNTQMVDVGEFEMKSPGYIKVDFQGLSKSSQHYTSVKSLILKSNEILNITYVKDNEDNRFYWGRRGPSVHLSYNLPEDKSIKWFYNEIVVPEGEDPIGSYYMANGFGEGYFGIQVNSNTERRVLFSVWSPFKTDNPSEIPDDEKIKIIKKGEGVNTGEFGNEGSGGQSYFRYNWKAGTTYRFLNSVEPDGKGSTIYTAYFFAPEVGKWKLIASFLRPKTDTWYKRPHSFLENFNDTKGYVGRRGFYKNQWARDVEGNWIELDGARFTGDDIARREYRVDYSGGLEGDSFFLRNGGFFDEKVDLGTSFKRPKSSRPPEIDFKSLE